MAARGETNAEEWDDHDELYEIADGEGHAEREAATATEAPPTNGSPPAAASPPTKERRATAKASRPRAPTAEERDETDVARFESDAALEQADNELKLLKAAARSMWRVVRTRVNPGLVEADDPAEIGGAGEVPAARYQEVTRQRWGGGDYTVTGIGKDGKAFGPLLFTLSGKSKPLHPEDEEGTVDQVGVFLDGAATHQPPVPVGRDAFGNTIYGPPQRQGPPPGMQQIGQDVSGNPIYGPLPQHLQSPHGYGQGPPQQIHPLLEAAKKEIARLEAALTEEKREHSVTRAHLERERAEHEKAQHRSEIERVRAEEKAAREQLAAENKAAMLAMEARLTNSREDPLAGVLREQAKDREAQEARFREFLAALKEKPQGDDLVKSVLLKLLDHKAEGPLAQIEMIERLAAITDKGGKGEDDEEGGLAQQLIGGIAKVLNSPASPFSGPAPTGPGSAVGYPAQQPPALPAPATAAQTQVTQTPVAQLSGEHMQWLVLIDQVFGLIQASEYPVPAAQKLKVWGQNNQFTPKINELASMEPAAVRQTLASAAANPLVPGENRARIQALVSVFDSPQSKPWVEAFWAELRK